MCTTEDTELTEKLSVVLERAGVSPQINPIRESKNPKAIRHGIAQLDSAETHTALGPIRSQLSQWSRP